MDKPYVHITRIRDNGVQTLGRLKVVDPGQQELYRCVTLEPSFVLNETWISCVPPSKYTMAKRTSDRFGEHFHVKNVPGRSFILMHGLNFYHQTEGCIGAGERFKYLNDDAQYDLVDSGDTLRDLLDLLPEECCIEIENHDQFQAFYR